MKKIGLLFLVVMLSVGLAGCPKSKDEDPVGTWRVTSDIGCDGSTSSWFFHIFENETFIDSDGFNGTWSVNDDNITMNYNIGVLVFSANVDNDRMTGTFTGTVSGCWSAQRTSTSP